MACCDVLAVGRHIARASLPSPERLSARRAVREHGSTPQDVASALNGALLTYALATFAGWRQGWVDLTARVARLVLLGVARLARNS